MTPITLHWNRLSDAEKNAAIAQHVLKCEIDVNDMDGQAMMRLKDESCSGQVFESWMAVPDYLGEHVTALLEGWTDEDPDYRKAMIQFSCGQWIVELRGDDTGPHYGSSKTMNEAAMIALLRAAGVTVET